MAGIALLVACGNEKYRAPEGALFRSLDASESGIDFVNELRYSEQLNPYTFRSFFNGGGVGLGDFDNDGLIDVFLSGNQVPSKLYRNTGKLEFEDLTETAGIPRESVWVTGVSIVDINADGFLDIYLCKSGPPGGTRRKNELFVNDGGMKFTEQANAYGLDFEGLSIHAAFFDYDKDGDLDCYLLNNSMRNVGGFDLRVNQRTIPDPDGGNRLLRNDNNKYVDVSQEAGIYTSKIGFGLGVTIADLDKDNWPDIYVSNDFFERDYLYFNQKDGTFAEQLDSAVQEISMGSMGADIADINNDGLPEIYVTEMLPEHDQRLKTTSLFENWDKYYLNKQNGYHRQFSRNTLQLNNGNGTFSEISRFAGTHATDWSWGAIISDLDNDGYKDIFVANGIYKDLIDQDYINFTSDPEIVRQIRSRDKSIITRLVDSIPSNRLANYAFRNNHDLTFTNSSEAWGLAEPSHSNGSAFGDLDNDGDLDLIVNNVNMKAFVYENKAETVVPENKNITVVLRGAGKNPFAIGAKVSVKKERETLYQELSPMRGFMSTVDYRLHFGVGSVQVLDTVEVLWPNGMRTVITNVKPGKIIELAQSDANISGLKPAPPPKTLFTPAKVQGLQFSHQENDYVDFDRDRLLFNMISNEGPCVCTADINRDGTQDIYLGGARGQAGALLLQDKSGSFKQTTQQDFESDKDSEDTDCVFADVNSDGFPDLYVTSGSNETSSSSSLLLDRLYINNRGSKFNRTEQSLPAVSGFESTNALSIADFDGDGDQDFFVGVRSQPFFYGLPGNGYLLLNDGNGVLRNVSDELAPGFKKMGLITDSQWADLNSDGKPDLVVVGEWMPIKIFIQEDGKLVERTSEYKLGKFHGWYHSVAVSDVNGDGRPDIIAGNHGLNSRFKTSISEPLSLYVNDFDDNGTIEHIITRYDNGVSLPIVMRQDLVAQVPALKKKYLYFRNYANQTLTDIFSPQQLQGVLQLDTYEMETLMLVNDGQGFTKKDLPPEVQFSPVYAILPDDFDGDGDTDLLVGGNLHRAKPETGIYAASYGLLLANDGSGNFTAMKPHVAGISITGEIRDIEKISIRGKKYIIVGRNNEQIQILSY
jgi:hypothetical protein